LNALTPKSFKQHWPWLARWYLASGMGHGRGRGDVFSKILGNAYFMV